MLEALNSRSLDIYCNPSFDAQLGTPKPEIEKRQSDLREQFRSHYYLAGSKNDCIVLEKQPIEKLFLHWETLQYSYPKYSHSGRFSKNVEFQPFGWNRDTERINQKYISPTQHPDLDIIKKCNNRSFALEVEKALLIKANTVCPDLFQAQQRSRFSVCIEDLDSYLEKQLDIIDFLKTNLNIKWLRTKPVYSFSGQGQKNISAKVFLNPINNWNQLIQRLRLSDAKALPLILESCDNRLFDFSISWDLSKNGFVNNISYQKTMTSNLGSFQGAKTLSISSPQHPEFEKTQKKFSDILEQLPHWISEILFKNHYWGPLGIDGYFYEDQNNQLKIRFLCDLNARYTFTKPMNQILTSLERPSSFYEWYLMKVSLNEQQLNELLFSPMNHWADGKGWLLTGLTETLHQENPEHKMIGIMLAAPKTFQLDELKAILKPWLNGKI